MKTVVIKEFETREIEADFVLDLTKQQVKDCMGCWTCWIKEPGHCVHHDLDDFYHAFYNSDRAIFLIQPSCGFISGNMKSLLDRMLPGFMPYIRYNTGESMHVPRYAQTPNIEIYYKNEFEIEEDRQLFNDYFERAMYQFYLKRSFIKPWMGEVL